MPTIGTVMLASMLGTARRSISLLNGDIGYLNFLSSSIIPR